MKTTLICILTLFLSYLMQENINSKQSLKFSIELPDTIYKGQQCIPIILTVENITSDLISIRNPVHWGNVYPYLNQREKNVPLIKIKINPLHLNETVEIRSKEVLKVTFDYTMDKIVKLDSLPSGKYEIHFQLQGTIPIKSEVFQFYKQ